MDPDSILDFSTDSSGLYSIEIGYFAYKIDMSTCQSVQADSCVLHIFISFLLQSFHYA